MLEIKNLDILINTRLLVNNLSFTLNKNDKLAIIGEEGNGKSTLLKCILGDCSYGEVSGLINHKNYSIGYLPQVLDPSDYEKNVYNFLFSSDEDYYQKITLLYVKLNELSLTDKILEKSMKNLSGGEKIKVGILKLLLNQDDILLLDEPTNDLDLDTLKWLENFIISLASPVIFVSHDEMFLSKAANMILHLEQVKKKAECKHTFLKLSYDEYISSRLRNINHQTQIASSEKRQYDEKTAKLTQVMNKVHHEQNTISRSDPHGGYLLKKKMKSLKSQEKRLENTPLTEKPDYEEAIYFDFDNEGFPNGKKVIDINISELKIKEQLLCKNVGIEIYGNEHIVIIGQNGVGKTTFIKEIVNDLDKKQNIKYGYMPQNYDDILNAYETPIDFLAEDKNQANITLVRSYLGNMNFTRDEMTGSIKNLSGGSKAKLFLLKLVLSDVSLLILDEPTRNVSPLSNPIIREKLKNYRGAIISVSHDRKYIEEVATKIYLLTKEGLKLINKNEVI